MQSFGNGINSGLLFIIVTRTSNGDYDVNIGSYYFTGHILTKELNVKGVDMVMSCAGQSSKTAVTSNYCILITTWSMKQVIEIGSCSLARWHGSEVFVHQDELNGYNDHVRHKNV